MKTLYLIAAVVAGSLANDALAQQPPGQSSPKEQQAACWCLDKDGHWVRKPTAPQQTLTGASTTTGVNSRMSRFQNWLRPDKVGGIDWYLNGRGPFSD
jgi:hypothetical protein